MIIKNALLRSALQCSSVCLVSASLALLSACSSSSGGLAGNDEALYLFDDGASLDGPAFDSGAAGEIDFEADMGGSTQVASTATSTSSQSIAPEYSETQYVTPAPDPEPRVMQAAVSRSSTSSSSSSSSSSATTHTVRRGDTLYGIAQRYGVSVSSLQNANGISGSMIRPGQKLKIRGGSSGSSTRSASSSSSSSGSYTVRGGDSLWSISRKHDTTVTAIQRANGLSGTMIKPGQTLKIP